MSLPIVRFIIEDSRVGWGEAEAHAGEEGAGHAGGESAAPPCLPQPAAALRPRLRAATGIHLLSINIILIENGVHSLTRVFPQDNVVSSEGVFAPRTSFRRS